MGIGKYNFERDETIDLIKGMGIFCMVAGHCEAPFKEFIYLFHMAVFFMASGYCYKDKNSDSVLTVEGFVKRKFKSLWFTYVLWTAIYSVGHNLFIRMNIYTDNTQVLDYVSNEYISTTEYWSFFDILKNILRACLFRGGTQLGGAFWFIATLMEIAIAYCVIEYCIKYLLGKKYVAQMQALIAIIFLFIGYRCYLNKFTFAGIERMFSYYVLFYLGFVFREYKIFVKERKIISNLIILLLSFVILWNLNKLGEIELAANEYENPFFLLSASFVGWIFLFELAELIKKIRFIYLKKIVLCMGQSTMQIMILHFLCFKIVNFIEVIWDGKPLFLVAAFPVLYYEHGLWIAYLMVGIVMPIFLSFLWKKIQQVLSSKVALINWK